MATYEELYSLNNDSPLLNKVAVACVIEADIIRAEDPGTVNHANRLIWAAAVFAVPEVEARRMLWALLAANKALGVAGIQGASDAAIQNNVSSAVNLFATGV